MNHPNLVYWLHFNEMQILVVFYLTQMRFQNAEAIFRSRLGKFSHGNKKLHFMSLKQKKSKSDKRRLNSVDECRVPSQLENYWIPFSKVLELSEFIFAFDQNWEIWLMLGSVLDIASFLSNHYQDPVRSTISRKLPYFDINTCVDFFTSNSCVDLSLF